MFVCSHGGCRSSERSGSCGRLATNEVARRQEHESFALSRCPASKSLHELVQISIYIALVPLACTSRHIPEFEFVSCGLLLQVLIANVVAFEVQGVLQNQLNI